ncbi:uncharacterized protein [Antedon mediterranea]|uniref:uncharacterized protein isoform X2 n=1 Tax=Antedon mediterranea TaxID=105859 RepID=UPI003AF48DB4
MEVYKYAGSYICIGSCRSLFWFLVCLTPQVSAADDSVASLETSSDIEREWFLYGSLISLAAAFIFLICFLCVCFPPCQSSSEEVNQSRVDTENDLYRGSVYNMYPGVEEPEKDKSTYELAKIESQNASNGVNGNNIKSGSTFLMGVKKLSNPSDQITTSEDKTVIESEIHGTIRHLSSSNEANGDTCDVKE